MASLVSLAMVPEVLFQILEDLPLGAVYSLLQTCRALYPACHRHLWSTLNFNNNTRSFGSPTEMGKLILHGRLIRDHGCNPTGLKYTKTLVLGPPIFTNAGDNHQSQFTRPVAGRSTEVTEVLRDLVDSGNLDLRSVVIDLTETGSSPRLLTPHERLLFSLKTYSQSKLRESFSVQVFGGTIRRISTFFHLETITKLEMGGEGTDTAFWPHNAIEYSGRRPLDWMGTEMLQLADLLSGLVNLEAFSWRHPTDFTVGLSYRSSAVARNEIPFSDFPVEQAKLQAAFTDLQKLRELQFHDRFFDWSFFIVPPEKVKKLVIGTEMADGWWRRFAACEMPSLKELEITIGEHSSSTGLMSPDFTLGDVAIRGLEKFTTAGGDNLIPSDLRQCLARRNSAYLPRYERERAVARAKVIMARAKPKMGEHAPYASVFVEDHYVLKMLTDLEGDYKHEFAREFAKVFISTFTGAVDIKGWYTTRAFVRSLGSGIRKNIKAESRWIVREMEYEYTAKFALENGLKDRRLCANEFLADSRYRLNVRIHSPHSQDHGADFLKASQHARELAAMCKTELQSRDFREGDKFCKRRNEIDDIAFEKIVSAILGSGSEADVNGIVNDWAKARVEFIDFLFSDGDWYEAQKEHLYSLGWISHPDAGT
ncbi:hypothetical protein TWF481_012184 [Arthrobotrys musiformis]|uniref:F-box domain-containing protein n=1 Tax=Arthrobotrys musiformis TaxID=47236 RepID=A0AAV9VXT2_9PEZI